MLAVELVVLIGVQDGDSRAKCSARTQITNLILAFDDALSHALLSSSLARVAANTRHRCENRSGCCVMIIKAKDSSEAVQGADTALSFRAMAFFGRKQNGAFALVPHWSCKHPIA